MVWVVELGTWESNIFKHALNHLDTYSDFAKLCFLYIYIYRKHLISSELFDFFSLKININNLILSLKKIKKKRKKERKKERLESQ